MSVTLPHIFPLVIVKTSYRINTRTLVYTCGILLQLKIKEALFMQWENPSLNHQIKH